MTTRITGSLAHPEPDERAERNAALLADNIETGFWNDQGQPAPWPDDIDEWTPDANELDRRLHARRDELTAARQANDRSAAELRQAGEKIPQGEQDLTAASNEVIQTALSR